MPKTEYISLIEKTPLNWLQKSGTLTKKGAMELKRRAKGLCPVGTITRAKSEIDWKNRKPGTVKRSIRIKKVKGRWNTAYTVRVGGRGRWGDAFYWKFIELGAPKHPKEASFFRPFMLPALDSMGTRR